MSYTKGPWVRHDLTDGDTAITDDYGVIDYPIALVRPDPSAPDNARLIASAPALLEAAQQVIRTGFATDARVRAIIVLRMAVEQALGEDGE